MASALFKREWLKPFSEMTEMERIEAATCVMIRHEQGKQYWGPSWEKGRTCFDYLKGKIFSDAEIAEIEAADKVPIQTPRAKTPMDAFMGMLLDTAKSGRVTSSGPEDAAGQEVINIALAAIERDNQFKQNAANACRDTQVSSVPVWMWIEPFDPRDPDQQGVSIDKQPWDSVIPSPQWGDEKLRDLDWAIRIRKMSLDEIDMRFEDSDARKRVYQSIEQIQGVNYGTVEERSMAYETARNSRTLYDQEGRLIVAEMTHWVRIPVLAWHCLLTGDHGQLPPMSDQELAEFVQMNPEKEIKRSMERVLWVTTTTLTGVLLANGAHWNQSGVFPGIPCLPDKIDGQWSGIFEYTLDLQKVGAYSETEWAHSIRTLTNNLWIVANGAVANMADFREQITTPNGVVELAAGHGMEEVKRLDNSREQRAFLEWMERSQQDVEALLVEKNFQGGAQSSQESNKVVETRIRQVISRLAPQIYNYHQFRLNCIRAVLKGMRFAITKGKIFRYMDPQNGMMEAEVNIPVEYDVMGEVTRLWNNLDSADYDYIEVDADDSVTGREHEAMLLREFLEAQANFPPEVIERAALVHPSILVQQFGKGLKEQREAKEKMPPPGPDSRASLTISSKDLGMAMTQKAAVKMGFLDEKDVEEESAEEEQAEPPEDGANPLPVGAGGPMIPQGAGPAPEEMLA